MFRGAVTGSPPSIFSMVLGESRLSPQSHVYLGRSRPELPLMFSWHLYFVVILPFRGQNGYTW